MIMFFLGLTVSSLLVGVLMMAIGNKTNNKWRTTLMSLRITFQSLALAYLMISYFLHN